MNEVIYQIKTIIEDLGFVRSSFTHTIELMKTSEGFKDFVEKHHLDWSINQASQFTLGAAMRLEMAKEAFEKSQAANLEAENAALRARVAKLEALLTNDEEAYEKALALEAAEGGAGD